MRRWKNSGLELESVDAIARGAGTEVPSQPACPHASGQHAHMPGSTETLGEANLKSKGIRELSRGK